MNPLEALRGLIETAGRGFVEQQKVGLYGKDYKERQAEQRRKQQESDSQIAIQNEGLQEKQRAHAGEIKAAQAAHPEATSPDEAVSMYRAEDLGLTRRTGEAKAKYGEAQVPAMEAETELRKATTKKTLHEAEREYETPEERAAREMSLKEKGMEGTLGAATIRAGASERVAKMRAETAGQGVTWQPSVDASGNEVRVAVPKNAPAGATVGGKGTAAEQNRESMSEVAASAGNQLLARLDDPQTRSVIGPAAGRYQSFNAAFLSGDPVFTGLKTEIRAISQVLTGIHNLRSAKAGEALESVLSTSNSPEALKGAVKGAMIVVDEFLRTKKRRGAAGGYHAPGEAAPASGLTPEEEEILAGGGY